MGKKDNNDAKSLEELILKYGLSDEKEDKEDDDSKNMTFVPVSHLPTSEEYDIDLEQILNEQPYATDNQSNEEQSYYDNEEYYGNEYYLDSGDDRYDDIENSYSITNAENPSAYVFEEAPDEFQPRKQNFFTRIYRFFIPCPGDGIGESIRKIVFTVSLVALIISGCILVPRFYEDWLSERTSSSLVDIHNNAGENDISKAEEILGGKLPEGILPEFAMLYAQNKDVVGWVKIPNTELNYPVAQSTDNEYYMHHDYYKNYTRYGVPFLDKDCSINPMTMNTVIYGHHMNNGTIFSALDVYKTVDGYKQNPIIQFDTIYSRHKWKVIGAFITNGDISGDNNYFFNYMVSGFGTEQNFNGFIDGVKQRSLFTTDVDVNYTDKLLTLQTCSYEFDSARLVVIARMVRDGEDENVNVDAAKENPNPRYPQGYYTAKGKTNPFANAQRWYPDIKVDEPVIAATAPTTTLPSITTTTQPSTTTPSSTTTTKPNVTTSSSTTTSKTSTTKSTTEPTSNNEPTSGEPDSTEPTTHEDVTEPTILPPPPPDIDEE